MIIYIYIYHTNKKKLENRKTSKNRKNLRQNVYASLTHTHPASFLSPPFSLSIYKTYKHKLYFMVNLLPVVEALTLNPVETGRLMHLV